MTNEPTAAPSSTHASTPDPADTVGHVLPSAAPFGVAPVAAGVPTRRRSRRRRMVDAAVVTSALATLPVAAAWNRAEPLPGDTTLVDAVSQLEEAEDETALRAAAAGLRASSERHGTRASLAVPPATMIPAADVRPAAPAGAGLVAPAPAPADIGAGSLGATPADATEEEPASPLVQAAATATASEPTPIARVAGVDLVAPSVDTVLVGFHEAAGGGTETMESLAPLAVELNSKETAVAPDASDEQVAAVMELPTRERGTAAASAVDVAVPAWQDIVAPVTGRVVTASPYTLYGEFADNRVEIEPDGQPGVRVVMLHIGEVEVRPGDRVIAGETVVAGTAKQFPITSQIDRFAEEVSGRAHPHVHMEVIRIG